MLPSMRRTSLTTLATIISLCSVAQAAEPTTDQCIDGSEAAQKARRAGHFREAIERFALCASPACPGPVREDCLRRRDEAERNAPTVVFDVRDAFGNGVKPVSLKVDGEPCNSMERRFASTWASTYSTSRRSVGRQ